MLRGPKRQAVRVDPGRAAQNSRGLRIATRTWVALRCPECGDVGLHAVSFFEFGRRDRILVRCGCGAEKLSVVRKASGRIVAQVPCILCDHSHFLYFSRSDFWRQVLQRLYCPETGVEIAFLGPEDEVGEMARNAEEDLSGMMADAQGDDYFDNPEVMYDVLNHLHHLAEAGQLQCPCQEGEVEVEVYPDRVELHCTHCHRWWTVRAGREEDLTVLDQQEIHLSDDGGHGRDHHKSEKRP